MRSRQLVSIVAVGLMLMTTAAFGVEAPPLVTPVPCATPGVNPRVTAQIPASLTNGYRPRVFFRANGQTAEYYVEMQRGANGMWWAILPAVDTGTASITYRVGALDSSKNWVTSAPITTPTSATCPTVTLTPEEQRQAQNIVLGMTTTQPPVPTGFSCRGVVSVITADGQMRPATECRAVLAAAGAPGAGAAAPGAAAATGAGLSAGTIAALSVGALTAAVVIHNNTKGGNQVSPSRP